jgi:hypothetical protein
MSGLTKLRMNLQAVVEDAGAPTVTIATGCSGTDLILAVLQTLSTEMFAATGVSISWKHLYSCDRKKSARDFIQAQWQPEVVFRNLVELDSDQAWDTLSGQMVPVTRPWLWACGFECDNYSALNRNREQGPGSVQSGRGPIECACWDGGGRAGRHYDFFDHPHPPLEASPLSLAPFTIRDRAPIRFPNCLQFPPLRP